MRQRDRNRKTDWLGRRIIILDPFKCQTGFRTLCLSCQTICSNLISITQPDSRISFHFSLSKCLLEINWWFSIWMSDKVDSRKQFVSWSSHRSLSVFLCNEVLLNYILIGWEQLLLVCISAHPLLLYLPLPPRTFAQTPRHILDFAVGQMTRVRRPEVSPLWWMIVGGHELLSVLWLK